MLCSIRRPHYVHFAFDVRTLKPCVLQRNRDFPVDEEQHVDPKFRPERFREPDSILLPLVHDLKPILGKSVPKNVLTPNGIRRDSFVNTRTG